MCLKAQRERGQGSQRRGRHLPGTAPLASAGTALAPVGAPALRTRRSRSPAPPPPPPTPLPRPRSRPLLPPTARPALSPGPRLPPSPCRGTPASTASRRRRRRRLPPPSPPAPGALAQPQLQSQSSGLVLAQRLALAPPALPSCFHMQYQSQTGRRPPPRKHLGRPDVPQYWLPLLGQGQGPGAPLSAVFLSTRMGGNERKPPQKTTENTQNR